jgi:Tfp pilus assembly protein PilE
MDMAVNRHRKTHVRPGVTLIEVVVSILVVMVLSTGALSYQYYSTRDVAHSEAQAAASRIAILLLESWKGLDGDTDYDPEELFDSDLEIQAGSRLTGDEPSVEFSTFTIEY